MKEQEQQAPMGNREELTALLDRVRAATGRDRELDWHIADATNHPSFEKRFENMWPPFGPKSKLDRDIPFYTASVDAALALTERVLPGRVVSMTTGDTTMPQAVIAASWIGQARTLPLAIIAATLSALIAQAETP